MTTEPSTTPAAATGSCSLPFDPVTDGFGFINRFSWTDDDLAHLSTELRAILVGAGASISGAAAWMAGGRRATLPGAAAGAALGAILGAGLVKGLARRWPEFGLCGGMAATAVDRWPHRESEPTSRLDRDTVRHL